VTDSADVANKGFSNTLLGDNVTAGKVETLLFLLQLNMKITVDKNRNAESTIRFFFIKNSFNELVTKF
jgi:hypothetical protein